MGYQALLFCPDEKTARTVTQVLGELDFSVVPCTEPFAAVKKLMGEHFDAVVVDCDNEQNATLLFKSARNTVLNQTALAVAVVEGQAGVAKAFRIGANLVLTKPINVEQAKGTLRVARGLLRKNEAPKPAAGATGAAVRPAAAAPAPLKVVSRPQISNVVPAPMAPMASAASASASTRKASTRESSTREPMPQPIVTADASQESDVDIFEAGEEISAPSTAPIVGQSSAPKITSSSAGLGTGAASAPAPARESRPSVAANDKLSPAISVSATPVAAIAASNVPVQENSLPAPTFTFGGNVDEAKSGSKKTLLAAVAVVVIAAGGYAAWSQWGHSSASPEAPASAASQSVGAPSAVSHAATNPVPAAAVSSSAPAVSSPSTPSSTSHAPAKTSSDTPTSFSESAHSNKASNETLSNEADTSKASAAAAKSVPAAKAPIVIGNGSAKPAPIMDAPAPTITAMAPVESGALPNLMASPSKAPTPVLQTLAISQGVSQGLVVKRVQPVYPASAMRLNIEGAVQLLATVSKSGDISTVKIISGDPQLARAAVDAVKQWKYKPYLLNGSPVEIQTQVTVNFKHPH
jgi:TonB family protein